MVAVRRRSIQQPVYQPPILSTASIPAPIDGLNLRDNIASLKPHEALILKNYIAGETDVRVRGGTSLFASGISGGIGTLVEWAGPGSRKFFAAVPTIIYEITSGTASSSLTSLTNAYWQSTMFTTAGGAFLVLANGADSVRNYDGTNWTTPAITNVTSATLNFVFGHKARLWFAANNSSKAWYLPTSSIAGAAVGFELGEQFRKGGKLMGMGSISRDSGAGADDLMVFVSSLGDVVVYEGTDPASATTWALVGTYTCAAPINNRCFLSIGGDLKIATKAGIVSVARLMASGQEAERQYSIASKIDPGIQSAYASYGTLTGWQMVDVPHFNLAYLNVPTSTSTAFQYVANVGRWAWTTNHDLNAVCWGTYNELPYFATSSGGVYLAETGYSDHGSVAIAAEIKPSFQAFGPKGRVKEISLVQPLFIAGGLVAPAIRVNVDYQTNIPVSADAFQHYAAAVGAYWDYGIWDEALWSDGSGTVSLDEYAATGVGSVASVHMLTSTTFQTRLAGINIKYKLASVITV